MPVNKETYPRHSVDMVTIFANVYGMLVTAYFALSIFLGDSIGFVAFCSNIIPIGLLPTFVLLGHAIKKRKKIAFLWGLSVVAFLFFEFGSRFLPNPIAPSENSTNSLLILSHNTGQDLPEYDYRDTLIRNSQADIVFLQEITKDFIDQYWPNLEMTYPYQADGQFNFEGDKQVGMGVLSRYPILESENFKLAEEGLTYQQRHLIDVNGTLIAAYNIHTTFPWVYIRRDPVFSFVPWPIYDDHVRRIEIDNLVTRLEQEAYPIILVGDFNFNDQTSDYQKLIDFGLVDAYRESGWGLGFTWPANRTPSVNIYPAIPSVRLDYLFYSKHFAPFLATVLEETGSDHRPIIVNLEMLDE